MKTVLRIIHWRERSVLEKMALMYLRAGDIPRANECIEKRYKLGGGS